MNELLSDVSSPQISGQISVSGHTIGLTASSIYLLLNLVGCSSQPARELTTPIQEVSASELPSGVTSQPPLELVDGASSYDDVSKKFLGEYLTPEVIDDNLIRLVSIALTEGHLKYPDATDNDILGKIKQAAFRLDLTKEKLDYEPFLRHFPKTVEFLEKNPNMCPTLVASGSGGADQETNIMNESSKYTGIARDYLETNAIGVEISDNSVRIMSILIAEGIARNPSISIDDILKRIAEGSSALGSQSVNLNHFYARFPIGYEVIQAEECPLFGEISQGRGGEYEPYDDRLVQQ